MVKRPTTSLEQLSKSQGVIQEVGDRIREARKKVGLTQSQLGVKADVPQSYIFEIETGGANITLRTLTRLGAALEIDARDLLPQSRGTAVSNLGLERMYSVLERVYTVIAERHLQDGQLLTDLRTFLDDENVIATGASTDDPPPFPTEKPVSKVVKPRSHPKKTSD